MMKKIYVLAIVGLVAATVAGCKTTGSTPPSAAPVVAPVPSKELNKIADTIAKVQTTTKKICSYVPTADTVASTAAAFGASYFKEATSIAMDICTAMESRKLLARHPLGYPRAAPPSVRGVPIRGRYV